MALARRGVLPFRQSGERDGVRANWKHPATRALMSLRHPLRFAGRANSVTRRLEALPQRTNHPLPLVRNEPLDRLYGRARHAGSLAFASLRRAHAVAAAAHTDIGAARRA